MSASWATWTLPSSMATSRAAARAVTTALGIALLGRPALAAVRRTATRAAFGPPAATGGDPGADTGDVAAA